MKIKSLPLLALLFCSLLAPAALAHCEIPCGIYGDQMRIEMLREHATTIEKSMKQVVALGKESPANFNQLARWVHNKELHCNEVQHIVTQYFMTQRIKPAKAGDAEGAKKYAKQLELLHGMLVAAMKAKQTTDPTHIATLRKQVDEFEALYFGKKEQAHLATDHSAHAH